MSSVTPTEIILAKALGDIIGMLVVLLAVLLVVWVKRNRKRRGG
jgi:hypothetical protein